MPNASLSRAFGQVKATCDRLSNLDKNVPCFASVEMSPFSLPSTSRASGGWGAGEGGGS